MRSTHWLLLLIAVPLVTVAAIVAIRRPPATSAPTASLEPRPSAPDNMVQRQLDDLKNEIRVLKQSGAGKEPQHAAAEPLGKEAAIMDREALAAAERNRRERFNAQIASSFRHEVRDAKWAKDEEPAIENALRTSAPPGTTVETVDCAATMCRVVTKHQTDESQHGLAEAISRQEPFRQGVYYSFDKETLVSTMYVARAGNDLPLYEP